MAYLIDFTTFTDSRGNLTVIEKTLPFDIMRVFYIYRVDGSERGGHRHKKTVQAAICIQGSCIIENNNGNLKERYLLNKPSKCLILETIDWHLMKEFSSDAILMVFASQYFDANDYIFEPYEND